MGRRIRGVLFDKDGTLFDFYATWRAWTADTLLELSRGDLDRAEALGRRVGFDLTSRTFDRDSPVIAGTPDQIADRLAPGVPEMDAATLLDRLNAAAARATQVEVVPLAPLLSMLRGRGLKLGVATNDAEAPARVHLASVGQDGAFDFVAGYDSGHGGKPGPGMCLAFAAAAGLPPDQVAMVGDSLHDLHAGRAAGMACVAVLTGPAAREELETVADAVLANIGELPSWLDTQIQ